MDLVHWQTLTLRHCCIQTTILPGRVYFFSPICASSGRCWFGRAPPATSSFRVQAWRTTGVVVVDTEGTLESCLRVGLMQLALGPATPMKYIWYIRAGEFVSLWILCMWPHYLLIIYFSFLPCAVSGKQQICKYGSCEKDTRLTFVVADQEFSEKAL